MLEITPARSEGGTAMTATATIERRELAHRTSDGIDVTLLWNTGTDQVTIAVLDTRSDESLAFAVDGRAALDAFNHPYAYAATRHACSVAPRGAAVTH
jgi:hypothetical protein